MASSERNVTIKFGDGKEECEKQVYFMKVRGIFFFFQKIIHENFVLLFTYFFFLGCEKESSDLLVVEDWEELKARLNLEGYVLLRQEILYIIHSFLLLLF